MMFTNTKPTSFDYDSSGQLYKHVGSNMYFSFGKDYLFSVKLILHKAIKNEIH
jgi:hypothetical protein